jgi:hypothetical protein
MFMDLDRVGDTLPLNIRQRIRRGAEVEEGNGKCEMKPGLPPKTIRVAQLPATQDADWRLWRPRGTQPRLNP